MKKEWKIILFILIVPPLMGEVLSGSTPPSEFVSPFAALTMILLYGCGALLIREAKARWKLQWSVILLAAAYGLLEEGIIVKSFFNPGWQDMGVLSGYAMYFGVQWSWAVMLILFHATMSTLIPITLAEKLWPEYKYKKALKLPGIVLSFAGAGFVAVTGMIFFGALVNGEMHPFYPHHALWILSFVLFFGLIHLAYRLRKTRIRSECRIFPPWAFGALGFLFMAHVLLLPNALAGWGVRDDATLLLQLIGVGLTIWFVLAQAYNRKASDRHIVALVFGAVLFWILFAPVIELQGGGGMLVAGVVAAVLMILWRRKVLRNK